MKKYNSKNNIIVPVFFIIVLLIAAFFLYKEYDKKMKVKKYEESIQEFQEFSAEYIKQTVMPRNIYELFKYDGEYDRDTLYKNMKGFVNYLGYLKNNINTQNAERYYSSNADEVRELAGIETFEDFMTLIQKMEMHNVYSDKYLYAEVVVGSSDVDYNYYLFLINFYYGDSLESNNIEKTTFQVAFQRKKDSSRPVCIYGFANQ